MQKSDAQGEKLAASKCGFCSHTRFELKEGTPVHSNYKIFYVQCASCGAVVGTQEYKNAGALLVELSAAVKKIARHFGVHTNL